MEAEADPYRTASTLPIVNQALQYRGPHRQLPTAGWTPHSPGRLVGHLQYDSDKFEVDDRLLSHLQVVIAQKARRRENFMLTLHYRPYGADVMSSLWFSHSSSVQFAFAGSRPAQLSQVWLEEMMAATHTTQGLDTARVPEPIV